MHSAGGCAGVLFHDDVVQYVLFDPSLQLVSVLVLRLHPFLERQHDRNVRPISVQL